MTTDFFLYDTEQLNTLATEDTVKKGLAYFTENRVFALDVQENLLTAQVEGSIIDQPYWVELSRNEDDLYCRCDCENIEETIFYYNLVPFGTENGTSFIQTSNSTIYLNGTIIANWTWTGD